MSDESDDLTGVLDGDFDFVIRVEGKRSEIFVVARKYHLLGEGNRRFGLAAVADVLCRAVSIPASEEDTVFLSSAMSRAVLRAPPWPHLRERKGKRPS